MKFWMRCTGILQSLCGWGTVEMSSMRRGVNYAIAKQCEHNNPIHSYDQWLQG